MCACVWQPDFHLFILYRHEQLWQRHSNALCEWGKLREIKAKKGLLLNFTNFGSISFSWYGFWVKLVVPRCLCLYLSVVLFMCILLLWLMASVLFQFCAVSNELCAIFKDLWPCSTCLIKFKATTSATTTTRIITNATAKNHWRLWSELCWTIWCKKAKHKEAVKIERHREREGEREKVGLIF